MNIRQFSWFQRTIAVLFVLTGLSSQLRVVFACDLMDGRPSSVCCCGEQVSDGCAMGGGCGWDNDMFHTPDCCEVSVEMFSDVTVGGQASAASQVALQHAAQPPPVALCSIHSRPHAEFSRIPISFSRQPYPHFVRTGIYLVTNRLRI